MKSKVNDIKVDRIEMKVYKIGRLECTLNKMITSLLFNYIVK